MVYEMKKVTGFPPRARGRHGRRARHRALPALPGARAGVTVKDVRAMVLGGHGDTMVPVTSATAPSTASRCSSSSRPGQAGRHRRRARASGGGEIVKLMGTSAYYAPAAAAIQMAELTCTTRSVCCPCAAYLDGEYGYKDLYIGVPVVIGGKRRREDRRDRARARRESRCSTTPPRPYASSSKCRNDFSAARLPIYRHPWDLTL